MTDIIPKSPLTPLAVHFSSKTDDWATPQDLYDQLNKEFHFTLDPCATKENAKCARYFSESDDGLSKSWDNETIFCNPPYGREIGKWVKKASEARGGLSSYCCPLEQIQNGFMNMCQRQMFVL